MRFRVVLLLLVGALGLAAVGCGGSEEVTPTPETVSGTVAEQTTDETTQETTTEENGAGTGDAAAGEAIFAAQGCGGCHTLEAAGSTGAVGPNLDDAQPDEALVIERVTNGAGAMPAFKDKLDEQQVMDVAAYVVESTSGG